jgi:hypothetical protein
MLMFLTDDLYERNRKKTLHIELVNIRICVFHKLFLRHLLFEHVTR